MDRRLKVCLLVNDLRIGGAERQLIELARGLDHERFEPIVVTLYPGGALEPELAAAGIQLQSLSRSGRLDFAPIVRLARLLGRERVDVIQPFLTPATFFGLTAALMARTPVTIVTERCGLRVNPGAGSSIYRFAEDRLTRFARAAIPNSHAGARYLQGRGIDPEKITVIYNGVSSDRVSATEREIEETRLRYGIPDGCPVVGMVASLQEAKDHRTLLRAMAKVKTRFREARCLIVGDGELRPELESLAKDLGVWGSVIFTGNEPRVAPTLALLDVAVLSSCDHEGCSNAILEGMGLGKPVVCTNVGGNSELVSDGENGFVVDVRSPDQLADRISTLLANPNMRREMGERGRERFRREFTLETMVQRYEDMYLTSWSQFTSEEIHLRQKEAQKV